MVSSSELTQIVTVLVSVGLFSDTTVGQMPTDDCRLQQHRVNVSKQVVVALQYGNVDAACSKMLFINKCEGVCRSFVYPSVQTHSGFGRTCRCCKENATTTRDVLMTCTVGGLLIPNYQQSVRIKDITGCHCVDCSD